MIFTHKLKPVYNVKAKFGSGHLTACEVSL